MNAKFEGVLPCLLAHILCSIAAYRNCEIQIVINLFKVLDNNKVEQLTGVELLTREQAAAKYSLRVNSSGKTPKIDLAPTVGSLISDIIPVVSQLKDSDEAIAYFKHNGIQMAKYSDHIKALTVWDIVKLFDPMNSEFVITNSLLNKLQFILFSLMDIDGNQIISYSNFVQLFCKDLKALPKNQITNLFVEISKGNIETGNISWDMWNHYSEKFSLISLLTHNRVYFYDRSNIEIAKNFFKELDREDNGNANGHLSAKEAGDKYYIRLLKAKASNKRMLAAAFQSWIECFINASQDLRLVKNLEVLAITTRIEDLSEQLEEIEMAVLLDPTNDQTVQKYNLRHDLPRILFAWMDLDGSGDITRDEFLKTYGIALKVGTVEETLDIFDSIPNTKSMLRKSSIDLMQWEAHCGWYWNMASILAQRAVMAG